MTIWFICAISYPKEENRKNYIHDILRTLTKREELVLRLYFGILYGTKTTLSELGQDFEITQGSVRRIKNKGILKVINRVTNKELFESGVKNHWIQLSSHINKDLIERCIDERKSKLLDEFMVKLLKIDWEEWVLK